MFGTAAYEYIIHQLQHEKCEEQVNWYVHKLSGGKIQQQLVLKQLFYNFVSRTMYVSKHN